MTTPILKISEVVDGQVDQYLTYNEALRALESSANNFYVVDLTSSDVTLTDEANADPSLNYIFSRNQVFRTSGNAVARVVTVPQTKRLFIIQNAGTSALEVKRGATEISIAAGNTGIFYVDGTTNGLIILVTAGASAGVESISPGDGIDVDNTDPANPIISATGASGGEVVVISGTTYTVSASDSGKFLVFSNTSSKSATFELDATTPLPDNGAWIFYNEGANDLTIVEDVGVVVAPPGGGSLVIPSGSCVGVKRLAADSFVAFGSSAP